MTYFKIVQDGKVVSIGQTFLKWKKNRYYICDANDGQFIQSFDESKVYRDDWMRPAPEEAKGYEIAEISAINETEFEDFFAQILDGEEIVEEPIPEEQTRSEAVEIEEEKPMSIAQMRKIILEQQKQIELLMSKIK